MSRLDYQRAWRAANREKTLAYGRRYRETHKEELAERQRVAHKANREKRNELGRNWRQANPEKVAASKARYAAKYPERIRAKSRSYYLANSEAIKEYQRKWRAANPEHAAQFRFNRKVRMRNAPSIPFTNEQLAARMAYFGNRCWICGTSAGTIDHVKPIVAGGWNCLSNLRPACLSCNSRKKDRWPFSKEDLAFAA